MLSLYEVERMAQRIELAFCGRWMQGHDLIPPAPGPLRLGGELPDPFDVLYDSYGLNPVPPSGGDLCVVNDGRWVLGTMAKCDLCRALADMHRVGYGRIHACAPCVERVIDAFEIRLTDIVEALMARDPAILTPEDWSTVEQLAGFLSERIERWDAQQQSADVGVEGAEARSAPHKRRQYLIDVIAMLANASKGSPCALVRVMLHR